MATFDSRTLEAVLALSREAVVVCSGDGKVVRFSSSAEVLLGHVASDVVGRSLGELVVLPPERAKVDSFSTRAKHRDGRSLEVVADVSPFDGGVVAVLRLASDSASTAWDAERLNVALAAARLGDFSWDVKSDVVTFSKRAAAIHGIPAGPHMTREAMFELVHPEDREAARLAVDRAIAARDHYTIEYRLVNGGRSRWVSASGRARYDAHGNVLGVYGVVQELTRDRVLLRVDDVVRSLVRPEDITYTAARVLGEYLDVNRCAYAFVEDDEDTFTLTGNYTNDVASIVGRYRFRQFGAECLRLMRAGAPYIVADSETDTRIDDEDRKAYRMTAIRSVICVPITKSSRFVAAMAVHMKTPRTWSDGEVELLQQVASRCWESIERARVEAERAALLEAAQAANRAKDEFLAMLGHELRNPLAPIVTALALMKKSDASNQRERTIIERQVTHLTRLVDDLLDVSRIARGKVELKRTTVEIADVVTRAIEVASPLLEQRAHAIEIDIPRSGLAVDVDPARLVQVVTNLLTNAGKYTPNGGRIAIAASMDGEDVVLSVRDDGVGMSTEVLPRVFDLFVQGPQAIDRAHGGLGLGLAIVKNLVESHGGRVSAHSDGVGRGSKFVVRLPRARTESQLEAPRTTAPPKMEDSTMSSRPRILVVDDNVDAAEMLATALEMQNCEVKVAHEGPKALELCAESSFDAALLDIGLPVMDGYELASRLRQLPTLARARLVAITGYGQESDRRRALAAGFHEHLVKPVDISKLAAIVESVASSGPARPHES